MEDSEFILKLCPLNPVCDAFKLYINICLENKTLFASINFQLSSLYHICNLFEIKTRKSVRSEVLIYEVLTLADNKT